MDKNFRFFIGTLFSLSSWFIDNASQIETISKILFPDYINSKNALIYLDKNENNTVKISTEEGKALLRIWPKSIPDLPRDFPIVSIGRTGVIMSFSGKGGSYYRLRLRVGHDELRYVQDSEWRSDEAKEKIENYFNEGIMSYKLTLFFVGTLTSFFVGIFEFIRKPDNL